MGTMNFSVPDEVKEAFNQTFANENKSAIVSKLMMQAVEERARRARRQRAMQALLELREEAEPRTGDEIREARTKDRP